MVVPHSIRSIRVPRCDGLLTHPTASSNPVDMVVFWAITVIAHKATKSLTVRSTGRMIALSSQGERLMRTEWDDGVVKQRGFLRRRQHKEARPERPIRLDSQYAQPVMLSLDWYEVCEVAMWQCGV